MPSQESGLWLAGFDAGQTHSRCRLARRLADGQLQVMAEGEGPGVRHLAAPGGPEQFQQALRQSLAAADQRSSRTQPLAAAAIGASGIEVGTERQHQGRRLAANALAVAEAQVLVTGDEQTACPLYTSDAADEKNGVDLGRARMHKKTKTTEEG